MSNTTVIGHTNSEVTIGCVVSELMRGPKPNFNVVDCDFIKLYVSRSFGTRYVPIDEHCNEILSELKFQSGDK